jgi:rhamnogalacturonyl hydrolase YesR
LDIANELFDWLEDSKVGPLVEFSDGTVAWKIDIDPQGGNTDSYATGIEEGNAGIGWVYVQAYNLTGNERYLNMAKRAADWLINVAGNDGKSGLFWHEDMNPVNPLVHKNLDNGNAGIGVFLEDLAKAGGDQKYHQAAIGALTWIKNTARHNGNRVSWDDNSGYQNGNSGPTSPYSNDPSWHWGDAGILNFMVLMQGGTTDIPGEQSGLLSRP